jgi:hypothetical protein
MNKVSEGVKTGLIVAGIGVLLYLLYTELNRKGDVVVVKKIPTPLEEVLI